MWDHDKSLLLSIISVRIFIVIWFIFLFGGYFICNFYVEFTNVQDKIIPILPALYLCLVPAFIILYDLNKVLVNIRKEEVFNDCNVHGLRRISWACLLIAAITVVSAILYLPFLFISIAFGFLALLIRIIKNIIAQAIEIKTENDYTI